MVERGLAFRSFRIEQATLETLAIGEADGGGEALAQRTGGHFDARGQAVFRMTRGTGVGAATEVLQIVQGQAVAGEVQLDVLGEGGVATGKNEAIAAFPVGVVRIMLDEVLVQGVGDRRQGDGGTGWPCPARSTASADRTLAILMARSSSSVSLNSVMDYFPSNWSGRVSGLCRALDALTLRFP